MRANSKIRHEANSTPKYSPLRFFLYSFISQNINSLMDQRAVGGIMLCRGEKQVPHNNILYAMLLAKRAENQSNILHQCSTISTTISTITIMTSTSTPPPLTANRLAKVKAISNHLLTSCSRGSDGQLEKKQESRETRVKRNNNKFP